MALATVRQILRSFLGSQAGMDSAGALVVNKLNGGQLVIDGTYIEAFSRSIVAADNGKTLECTNSIALTFNVNTLPKDFSLLILVPTSANSVTLRSDGTAKLNGATADVVLAGTTSSKFSVIALASAVNSYLV